MDALDCSLQRTPRRSRYLLLQPDIDQRLGSYSALAGDLPYLTQQVVHHTDVVGAVFQLHLEMCFLHVFLVIGATVRVPELAGLLRTVELLGKWISLSLSTFFHSASVL
jgi:hypothetical protein